MIEIKRKVLLIILLLVSLVFIFNINMSLAIQNGLSNLKIRGNDGVYGYVRGNDDEFYFSVTAKNNGLQIKLDNVRLLGNTNNTGFAFDTCIPGSDGSYECKLTREMSGFVICPKTSFDVNLYDLNGNFLDDDQINVICDTLAPTITASVDKQKYGSRDNVTVSYLILDVAYPGSLSNECVGVKGDLRIGSNRFNKGYNINPGVTCSYSSSITEPAIAFNSGNSSDRVSVNITGFDNFGRSGSVSVFFDTDFQGVSFILNYFNISNLNHAEIEYFTPMDVLFNFGVDVAGSDLDESTIRADLTELGVVNAVASCHQVDGKKRCEWKNIRLFLQEPSISKTITVSGKDLTGNEQTSVIVLNKVLSVDNDAPRIHNLQIKNQKGERFNFTSPFPQKVTVTVDITEAETGLALNSVKADLSALNTFQNYETLQKDFCTAINENITTCTWGNIYFNSNRSGLVQNTLTFSAGDLAGNNRSENLNYQIFVDSESPVPLFLNVEGQQPETLNYISQQGNTFVLTIQEDGSGLNAMDVSIDARQLTGNPKQPADNCSQMGDIYTCYWYNMKSLQFSGKSFISTSTTITDRVGNLVNSSLLLEVEIDNKDPIIENFEHFPKFPTYNDKILISAKVSDNESGVRKATFYPGSILNASELGMDCQIESSNEENNEETNEGNNQSNRRNVKCSVELTGLEKVAKTDKVKIIVEDFAGNTVERNLLLEISEPIVSTPDFFTVHSTTISPSKVPRKAVSQVAFSMFAKVSLAIKDIKESAQIISASAECSNSSYVDRNSIYLLNEGTLEPIIGFRLAPTVGGVTADRIKVNCKLNMIIKKEDLIFSRPEVESVELNIPLYDAPIGAVDENVNAKLGSLNTEITDLEKEIKSKEEYANILATWCTISKLMGELNSILQNVKMIYYTVTSFQEISTIAAIDAAIVSGSGCVSAASAAAAGVCSSPASLTPVGVSCCAVVPALVPLATAIDGSIAPYQAIAKTGDIAAVANAESIAVLLDAASIAALPCPASAVIAPCMVGASAGIYAGTAAWATAKSSFVSICTKYSKLHSFIDTYIWPPGPFGISAVSGGFGLNTIGMMNKMGCAISYQCALCDWDNWMELGVSLAATPILKGVSSDKSKDEPSKASYSPQPEPKVDDTSRDEVLGAQTLAITNVPGPEDFRQPEVKYKPDNNGWRNAIIETEVPKEIKEATWIFDPYKSKPYAYACLCYPAIVYNLKKERQVKCMYRNCIQHELASGITTSACDLAYKERQCLYVDGAQFKIFGNKNAIDGLINIISTKLPFLIGGIAYKAFCGTYSSSGDEEQCAAAFGIFISTAGTHPISCGIVGTVQTLLELKGVWDTIYGGFGYTPQELGEDYCISGSFPDIRRDY